MPLPTTHAEWLHHFWDYGECAQTTRALAEGAAVLEALAQSPFDMSPCMECGAPVICLPEGLAPMCEDCAGVTP